MMIEAQYQEILALPSSLTLFVHVDPLCASYNVMHTLASGDIGR